MTVDVAGIIERIRGLGYSVEAGTAGYRVRFSATDSAGFEFIVTEDDEVAAAVELLKLIEQREGLPPSSAV